MGERRRLAFAQEGQVLVPPIPVSVAETRNTVSSWIPRAENSPSSPSVTLTDDQLIILPKQ